VELFGGLSLPAEVRSSASIEARGCKNTKPRARRLSRGSYVGIDLHRRRSVVVVLNEDGYRVVVESDRQHTGESCRPDRCCARAAAEGAMEATSGW
jgi:hypothetical protein